MTADVAMTEPSRLTTHVLNLVTGRPAVGMAVVLSRLEGAKAEVVCATATNDDGRTSEPLLAGAALTPGRYELAFALGAYFGPLGEGEATIPYLDVVPIHFGLSSGVGHVHVALLVSPWAYTTYRGS
ncbi:MAG: Transthyretin [Acidimicrobiia bacterium]|nr:Transthyretin [Acidimicrobiia bacterium]